MFKLPLFKKYNFLGIDFGTSSIKVVELTYRENNAHLLNYGWAEMPNKAKTNKLDSESQEKEDVKVTQILGELLDKMNIESNSAHISVGGFRGLTALIKVDKVDDDDIAEIIKTEASKHIPISLEEVYLSWDVVSKKIPKKFFSTGKNKSNISIDNKESAEVLLVPPPKEDVRRYEGIIADVDLKVASLELDIFSVVRSMVGSDLGIFRGCACRWTE